MEAYERLEREWAEFNGLDPAGMVACSSGTAALHLALEAFQLPQGSEVVVPDFTMVACPRAVTLAGLTPVFVDCDERLLMDHKLIWPGRGVQWRNVRAVMPVHVYGRTCNHIMISNLAAKNGWAVVEDYAEAHGCENPSNYGASAGHAKCWSFYRNKIVAGEEGGAVWFKDKAHADLARQLRCLGFTEAHDFRHVPRGHNYRMSNLHAERILNGFDGLHAYRRNIEHRRMIEQDYEEYCPDEWRMPSRDAPWVYDLRIRGLGGIGPAVDLLRKEGIAARHGFRPMSSQEEYQRCRVVRSGAVSKAGYASREVLYLPIQPEVITEEDCIKAFKVLRGIVG